MSQILEQPPIDLIPETAPFTAEQRAWLNGFFAGWMGLAGEANAASIPKAPGTDGHGSPAVEEESSPWHDPALPLAERLDLAKGKPLSRRLMAAMAQLDCGACGYVCKTYAEKVAAGEETCLTLCSPGGKETSKALKQLLKEGTPEPGASATGGHTVTAPVADAPGSQAKPKWSRDNPCPATLLRAVNLNAPGSDKQTAHVELDLGDSGLTYEAGDSLGVWPTNCDELVSHVMERLGASGNEPVRAGRMEMPFREALSSKLCLAGVTEELLVCLADAAGDGEAYHLRGLAEDDGPLNGCDVLDVLRLFPSVRPEPAAFAAALSPLRPRLYSISSSPKAHPGQVHLTVGRVAWEHNGRARKGVCSTLFADRLSVGSTVPVFVQKAHGFTVPADPSVPMIMIGPGTGIAPFRSFLGEREATDAPGRNWLFFGDRHAATDFLYRDELEAWRRSGLLTRLDLAFSRDGDAKVYVQDRMRESGAELWAWLDAGASVFVCGDAKRMAADVHRALVDVVEAHGRTTPETAAAYVAKLMTDGRYRRDVY
jgi:sulfite reductase (NADPH) flavoprotein alpha-component